MDNTTDLLQIKIEEAKKQLPEETLKAIATVPWQAIILQLRETKGYTFEQLGDLEIETELLLCGLLSPENYSKELENRMRLSKNEVNELVKEMNNLVFIKIKENMIKETGKKEVFKEKQIPEKMPDIKKEEKSNAQILKNAGIEIVPDLPAVPSAQLMQAGKLELTTSEKTKTETPPILVQKLSGYVKNEVVETEHSLNNLSKMGGQNETPIPQAPKTVPTSYPPKGDPYRLPPE